MDAYNTCRLCIRPISNKDTNAFDLRKPELPSFLDKLQQGLPNVELQDSWNWPHRICLKCVTQVHTIHSFQESVARSQLQMIQRFGEADSSNTIVEIETIELQQEGEQEAFIKDDVVVEEEEEVVVEEELIECEESEYTQLDPIALPDDTIEENDQELEEQEPEEVEESEIVEVNEDQMIVPEITEEESLTIPRTRSGTTTTTVTTPKSSSKTDKIDEEEIDDFISSFIPITCPYCEGLVFAKFGDMVTHVRQEHATIGYVLCCSTKFQRKQKLAQHIKVHLNPTAFCCDQCPKTFASSYTLEVHREEMHLPDEMKKFPCEQCDKRFSRLSRLKLHTTRTHEAEVENPFKCPSCDKTFSKRSNLTGHMKRQHENVLLFVCDVCAKTFKTKQNFQQHQMTHSDQHKVKCDECGKVYSNDNQLRRHKLRHHSNPGQVFQCPHCPHTTTNKVAMNAHINYRHETAPDQFRCDTCGKGFKRAKTLEEHIAGTHLGEKLYKCKFCDLRCSSSANMYKHQKVKHPTEYAAMKEEREMKMYTI